MTAHRASILLKERMEKSIKSAESLEKLKRVRGAIYHFRNKDSLTFSQYQELLGAVETAMLRFTPPSGQAAAKGGA